MTEEEHKANIAMLTKAAKEYYVTPEAIQALRDRIIKQEEEIEATRIAHAESDWLDRRYTI